MPLGYFVETVGFDEFAGELADLVEDQIGDVLVGKGGVVHGGGSVVVRLYCCLAWDWARVTASVGWLVDADCVLFVRAFCVRVAAAQELHTLCSFVIQPMVSKIGLIQIDSLVSLQTDLMFHCGGKHCIVRQDLFKTIQQKSLEQHFVQKATVMVLGER